MISAVPAHFKQAWEVKERGLQTGKQSTRLERGPGEQTEVLKRSDGAEATVGSEKRAKANKRRDGQRGGWRDV